MEDKSFFEAVNSKTSFYLGLAAGIALMFIIGFFIMLGLFASGDGDKTANTNRANTNNAVVNNQPTNNIPTPSPTAPEVKDTDHVLGPKNAKITLIEFSDIQCPYCSRFHPVAKQLLDEYEGQIRWVYKHFPLDSIHPQARPAAEASECVADRLGDEKFFAYLDVLFANQALLSRDLYISEAVKLGANQADIAKCIDEREFRSVVEADYQQGITAGVTGTPSSFINGRNIPGALPYEQVQPVVESLL